MIFFQQDDIRDYENRPKRKWSWTHLGSGKKVKAENKTQAIIQFKTEFGIIAHKKDISNT